MADRDRPAFRPELPESVQRIIDMVMQRVRRVVWGEDAGKPYLPPGLRRDGGVPPPEPPADPDALRRKG